MGLYATLLLSVPDSLRSTLVLGALLIASLAATLWSALGIWEEIKAQELDKH